MRTNNKIIIILGTAHLKSTPGKCSPDGKFKEYIYSRKICKAVQKILQDMGYTVFIDIEDEDLKLSPSQELCQRCKIVNDLYKVYENCIYISIHVNAAASDGKWHNATGWEAYTSPGITKADKLVKYLYDAAEYNLKGKRIRRGDRGYGKESNLYVLKHTLCPAVLTENFFQDTKSDVEFLLSDVGFH